MGMGVPGAVVEVMCDGECMGSVKLGETLDCYDTGICLPGKDICKVKIKVLEGTGRFKGFIFE